MSELRRTSILKRAVLLHLGLLTALGILSAPAATLTWDSDPGTAGQQGGNGVWDTTNLNWWDGSSNVAWDNVGLHTTSFPNFSSGTLTLGSDVTVGFLNAGNTFPPHYTFNGDAGGLYKITLDPPTKSGPYQVTVDAWRPLTINAPVEISGYANQFRGDVVANGVISGSQNLSYYFGTLTLNGNNTFTGGFSLGNGTLVIGHNNALGTGTFGWESGQTVTAGGGDRVITNTVSVGNWNYGRIVAGSNDLTFTGNYEVRSAFGTSSFASLDIQAVDCVVTFGNFVTQTSGSNGGFKKLGAGTMVLNGTFAAIGAAMPFTVDAGALLVDTTATPLGKLVVNSGGTLGGTGTVSLAAGQSLTVNAGGTLTGTLTITGNVAIAGAHRPGNSPGLQTVAGDLTYTSGASVGWELTNSTTAGRGVSFDGINLTGAGSDLTFAGPTALNLVFTNGVSWADPFWAGEYKGTNGWLVYDVSGTTAGFGLLSLSTNDWLDSSSTWFSASAASAGGKTFWLYQDGSDIYLNFGIPEPSVLLLALAGGLLLLRKRRMVRG